MSPVFGGKAKVTPVWHARPSVQPVWPTSDWRAPPNPSAARGSGASGPSGARPPRMYDPYTLTSAKPTVLLRPSVKFTARMPWFIGNAPSPPAPVFGSYTNHDPTLAP